MDPPSSPIEGDTEEDDGVESETEYSRWRVTPRKTTVPLPTRLWN
jgi:hypothetical protein